MPSNINKVKRYKGKSIDQILQMKDIKRMGKSTLRSHINCVSSLFQWAVRSGYTDFNYASGFTLKKDKKVQDERSVFNKEDLKKIFESAEYIEKKFKHPYQYWVPLIALYTGARQTEVCQLYLEDIKQIGGVYVFDINDNEDKKIKNSSSMRFVPIHSKLIDLGLITYINQLKLNKEARLFPEIKRGRDGYGQGVSRWFGRYRKKIGIEDRRKVFHSFRHTFINSLKQQEVAKEIVANIAGHFDGSEIFGRYGEGYQSVIMQKYIEMIKFDFKHPEYY